MNPMKRTVLSLALVAVLGLFTVGCKEKASAKVSTNKVEVAAARDQVQKKLPVMQFNKREHDFGNIIAGTPQETVFTFTNTGDAPLIITDAQTTCGCTVPEWPKTPIAPNETGELLVKFNGSGKNQVQKQITILANTAAGKEILRIKAFVESKPNGTFQSPLQ
jgi:hypothetical protein